MDDGEEERARCLDALTSMREVVAGGDGRKLTGKGVAGGEVPTLLRGGAVGQDALSTSSLSLSL